MTLPARFECRRDGAPADASARPHQAGHGGRWASVVLAAVALVIAAASPARALPSFARQTGLACTACHSNYPELTALGRQFKMLGYELDDRPNRYPPLALTVQGSFTHTEAGQPGQAAPHFSDNDNPALDAVSVFYGGKIVSRLAAFVQGTYDGVGRTFALDNTDVRLARPFTIAGRPAILGLTLNNNPSVQDPWNTTPAWGFPYYSSGLAPAPAAATLIDGALAGQVYGLGAYTLWNNAVYLEAGAYRELGTSVRRALGVDAAGADIVDGFAPYWRLTLQHSWESGHYLSIGTFGLLAKTFPGGDRSSGTDRRTDTGVDLQYQFALPQHNVTLLLTWIREHQRWDASQALGTTAHASDTLNTVRATAAYMYDLTYGVHAGYFTTFGRRDTGLYQPEPVSGSRTGRPDSKGFIAELDWLPFNKSGGPSFWRWFNPKFSLQYVAYIEFNGAARNYDGSGRRASANNTLFLSAWMPF